MVAYWIGDTPAEPLAVVPSRDGEEVDLSAYATAAASYRDPAGVVTPAGAVLEADEVAVTLPQLTVGGLGSLTVKLSTAAGRVDTFDGGAIVVMVDDGWHTLITARQGWPGARALDDDELETLLEQARLECAAYAPAIAAQPDGTPGFPPLNYRVAQLMHARNRNAAAQINPATGEGGTDGFAVGAYPLDWAVKQVLRPQRRVPSIR